MLQPASDPRVYFAAERTLLAWLRTGITIMAFGFVIARFGLFLQLVQAQGGAIARCSAPEPAPTGPRNAVQRLQWECTRLLEGQTLDPGP